VTAAAHAGALSPAELASVVAGLGFGETDAVFFKHYRALCDGIVRIYRERGHTRDQTAEFMFEFREALIVRRRELNAAAVRMLEMA